MIGLSLSMLVSSISVFMVGKTQRWLDMTEKPVSHSFSQEQIGIPSIFYLLWGMFSIASHAVLTAFFAIATSTVTCLVAGVDLIRLCLRLDLVVDSVPPLGWEVETLTPLVASVANKDFRYMHGSYNHPDVVMIIVDWVLRNSPNTASSQD